MEIFSPGQVPYPGCYQCPRCNSREVYDSEKTINVSAMTIDVPGPVSSTIINSDKVDAKRCRHCNTVAPWIAHPKALAEMKARKAKKRIKIFKIFAVILSVIMAVVLVSNISSRISNKIESDNFTDYRAQGNKELEQVRSQWQSISDNCGLGYTVGKEEINIDPNYDLGLGPGVDIYIRIKAKDFLGFWNTEKGQSVDCFSEKIYTVKLSEKLVVTENQFKNRKDSWDFNLFSFYDGIEKDGTIYAQGVIGDKEEHLDGYLSYFDDYDEFNISMKWVLDKDWFARAQGL